MRARLVLQTLVLIAAAAASTPTNAAGTRIYYFNANCVDCALASRVESYGVLGVIKLRNYEDGLFVDKSNFSDFSYGGSDFIGWYHVGVDPQDGITETLDFEFDINPASSDSVSGVMPFSFDLRFGDGMGFHADIHGDWYTCAPAPGWPGNGSIPIHGGGDCSPFNNSDHGTGYWSDVAEVVVGPGASIDLPEPATLALVSLGLMAAAFSRSRKGDGR